MASRDDASLVRFRKEHIGRLFAELHRDFSARAKALFDEAGHTGVTVAHIQVFTGLPLEGARVTTLARHAGITKQSMGARVDELIALGYLERGADAADGRAAPVRFSAQGLRLLNSARGAIDSIEKHYAARLGAKRYRVLRRSLGALVEALDIKVPA